MTSIAIQKVLHLKEELKKKNPKLQGNYLITEKFEGWFVYVPYDAITKTWGSPISSAGRLIPSMEHTSAWFNKLPKPNISGMLIAEAYIPEIPFQIMNGYFNRSVGNYKCDEVIFKCHDFIRYGYNYNAADRYIELAKLLDYENNPNEDKIHRVPLLAVTTYNKDLWNLHFNKVIDKGGEGIVAKRETSLYAYGKRNADLLKLKLECTVDCLAIAVEIGTGEKGNLSVTLVSQRKNGIKIRTVINSHKYQKILIETPEVIIGKVVTIKAMEEYPDKQLRQPVFMYPRPDKDINDYE